MKQLIQGGRLLTAGRLDYGLRIDDGVASMLRIEHATIWPAET